MFTQQPQLVHGRARLGQRRGLRGVEQNAQLGDELDITQQAFLFPFVALLELAPAHFGQGAAHLGRITLSRQHIRPDGLEALAEFLAAGNAARTHQRLMFPGPGMPFLIIGKAIQRGNQHSRIAVGAKARIDLVQFAARHGQLHGIDQSLHRADRRLAAQVQEDQIQVGGVVQLRSAQIAVGDDGRRIIFR